MSDFTIEWIEETRKFSRPQIGAELLKKGHDSPIPLRLELPTTDPSGVIEVVQVPELSTETVAVLRAELTKEVLRAKDFYDRIEHPVKVEITAVPVDDALAAAIGPELRTCTVGIEVPKPVLHWRGPPFEQDDALIEVDADGEHEIEIRTWAEHYRPVEGDFGYDPAVVDFTHKTAPGFDPRMFGPHPNDRPWEKAPAGGPNNREHSRWISKLALPHPDLPGKVPPIATTIHVQVWSKGAITKRMKDEVSHRRGALLAAQIPIVLRPLKLVAELIRPERPFDADGNEVGAVLRISRQRDGKPLRKGVISWEVRSEGSRGTTVRPDQVELTEQDGGETTLYVTPPKLTYKPGDRFRDELIVYAGAGADRREIGVVKLLLRPAVKASISMKKKGFDCDQPGAVDLKAISSASRIKGTMSYKAENFDPHEEKTFPVCHAEIEVDCDGTPAHGELKTDTEGAFTWKLPELDEVFEKLPEEREYELTADRELPVASMHQDPEDALATYNEKLRAYAPLDLLSDPLQDDLRRYGLTFARQLCTEPDTSYAKIISASELLRYGAAGASTWQSVNDKLWARGATDVANFLTEGLATLLSAGNFGPHLATFLNKIIGGANRLTVRFLRWVSSDLVWALEKAVGLCTRAALALAEHAPKSLASVFEAVQKRGSALLAAIQIGLAEAAGQDASRGLLTLVKTVGDAIVLVGQAAWAAAQGLFWAFAKVAGAALDRIRGEISLFSNQYDRTLRWLEAVWGRRFGREDTASHFTFAKTMEVLAGWFVEWLSTAQQEGAQVASAIRRRFQLFAPAVEDSLRFSVDAASGLLVPASSEAGRDAYTRATSGLNTEASALLQRSIQIDLMMGLLDTLILITESVGMILLLTFSGGTATLAAAPIISKYEVVVGSMKMLVGRGILQALPSFWMASGVAMGCHTATVSLMTPASARP